MDEQQKEQPQPPQFSPKLRKLAAEIQQLFKDNDVAGVVQLFEPGFNEWAMHISPSFSVVELNEAKQLKINQPIAHPKFDAANKQKIVDTVNMLANFRLHTGKLSLTFTQAEVTVRGHFGIVAQKPKPGPPNIHLPGHRKNGRG